MPRRCAALMHEGQTIPEGNTLALAFKGEHGTKRDRKVVEMITIG
jgi:hypothetical protein